MKDFEVLFLSAGIDEGISNYLKKYVAINFAQIIPDKK